MQAANWQPAPSRFRRGQNASQESMLGALWELPNGHKVAGASHGCEPGTLARAQQMADKRGQKQHEKNDEKYLRNAGGGSSDTCKSQDPRNKGDQQKH
jgi:hypothetical protein